ncbi:hypothetical protein RF11_05242 [Thelohanellus kitauei]|uniref:Uncharacterized protein n=1 Tax=Thelohanellus kitauei TaxID=669202 RepID=A0A0C2NBJ3_THEKT|nr:hypothetical protein RF11_05242 [Thelohanellus kitauei]
MHLHTLSVITTVGAKEMAGNINGYIPYWKKDKLESFYEQRLYNTVFSKTCLKISKNAIEYYGELRGKCLHVTYIIESENSFKDNFVLWISHLDRTELAYFQSIKKWTDDADIDFYENQFHRFYIIEQIVNVFVNHFTRQIYVVEICDLIAELVHIKAEEVDLEATRFTNSGKHKCPDHHHVDARRLLKHVKENAKIYDLYIYRIVASNGLSVNRNFQTVTCGPVLVRIVLEDGTPTVLEMHNFFIVALPFVPGTYCTIILELARPFLRFAGFTLTLLRRCLSLLHAFSLLNMYIHLTVKLHELIKRNMKLKIDDSVPNNLEFQGEWL